MKTLNTTSNVATVTAKLNKGALIMISYGLKVLIREEIKVGREFEETCCAAKFELRNIEALTENLINKN